MYIDILYVFHARTLSLSLSLSLSFAELFALLLEVFKSSEKTDCNIEQGSLEEFLGCGQL